MNFVVRLSSRSSFVFGFLFVPAVLLAVTLVQKNPPVCPADVDSPVAIWDIDLKLANALPRNFCTTDDPLKPSKGETPATTGLSNDGVVIGPGRVAVGPDKVWNQRLPVLKALTQLEEGNDAA